MKAQTLKTTVRLPTVGHIVFLLKKMTRPWNSITVECKMAVHVTEIDVCFTITQEGVLQRASYYGFDRNTLDEVDYSEEPIGMSTVTIW